MNGTAIPWRIFFYRIPLARSVKNRTPPGWMIPQYRTLKSKLPKYRLKKSSILQYRKPPCPPHSRSRVLFADARMRFVISFRWAKISSDFFINFVRWPRCPLLEACKRVSSSILVSAPKKCGKFWLKRGSTSGGVIRRLIKMATQANTCLSPQALSKYKLVFQ